MKDFILTDLEFNQLAWVDEQIKNLKTPEQKFRIEEKEEEKGKERIEALKIELEEKRKREPRTMFLHNRTEILESDLTDDIIDKEIAFGFDNYK